MVRQLARGLAGLNALYQGIVGLLAIVSPAMAGTVYQLANLAPVSLALCRILGGLMVGSALLLAVFARDPEANPSLAWLLAAGCLANVAAAVAACFAGEVRWVQVTGSIVFQSALGAALGAYLLRARHSAR